MKKLLLAVTLFLTYTIGNAQTPYLHKDEKNGNGIILNGLISKYALENESSFTWYGSSRSAYTPDAANVTALEKAKPKYKFLIFWRYMV
jgi:hypothetical protein